MDPGRFQEVWFIDRQESLNQFCDLAGVDNRKGWNASFTNQDRAGSVGDALVFLW